MNEERELLMKAAARVRTARRGLLSAGLVAMAGGIAAVWFLAPEVTGSDSLGPLTVLVLAVVVGSLFSIGFGMTALALRDPDDETRDLSGWMAFLRSAPFVGAAAAWLQRRRDEAAEAEDLQVR